jgi:LysM repeat protein/soluble lytic murein transglycosylase-like protein
MKPVKTMRYKKLNIGTARLAGPLALLLATLALLAGCAGGGAPAARDAGQSADILFDDVPVGADALRETEGEADGALELTAEPAVDLEVDSEGRASLESLEKLSRTALSLAAEDRLDEAQDHLFVLEDQAEMPPPAGADSLYVEQQASLQRRASLLGAVLAEQMAFTGDVTQADSLLADRYARLAQTSFPDSLVPATGAQLSPITVDLLKVDNQEVARWVNYFAGRGRDHFQIWLERRAEVDSLISAILDENGLPRELIYLAVIESGLSSRAVSNVGAVGPWQFMAPTGRAHGLRVDYWVDERRDMELATRAACKYIRALYTQFNDWALVLAAYNTGEGRVERVINQYGHDDFWNLRLPSQTTAHIPKFIAAARIGEDPERYGFTVPAARPLHYDLVPVECATDLEVIAKCAGCEEADLKLLNPALVRGATSPDKKTYLVKVPQGRGPSAQVALAKVPAEKRLTWSSHRVARGETLGRIAGHYGTSVAEIARVNRLRSPYVIHPGDDLLIPRPGDLSELARARIESAPAKAHGGKAVKAAKGGKRGKYEPPAGWERVAYEVRRGDTVGSIARKLGVSVSHLRSVNALPRSNLIHAGQRLYAYRPPRG